MLEFQCPKCQKRIPFVEEFANREVLCLGCGSFVVFPSHEPHGAANEAIKAIRPVLLTGEISRGTEPPRHDA